MPRSRVDAAIASFRRLDRNTRLLAAGAAGIVVVFIAALALIGAARNSAPIASSRPSAFPAAEPSATPIRVRATPPGTPAPRPATFVGIAESVPVPSSIPKAPRATASPEPGLWRLEGYVMDETGQPIENVCVVVGPVGCQPFSPHSDERGHYFFDIAASTLLTNYDFYFEIPGHQTVWLRMVPTGSTTFNAVLKRT